MSSCKIAFSYFYSSDNFPLFFRTVSLYILKSFNNFTGIPQDPCFMSLTIPHNLQNWLVYSNTKPDDIIIDVISASLRCRQSAYRIFHGRYCVGCGCVLQPRGEIAGALLRIPTTPALWWWLAESGPN